MSGYPPYPPYGAVGGGVYPGYPLPNNTPVPPQIPMYGANDSMASFYGTPPPPMFNNTNYPMQSYDTPSFPSSSYGFGGTNNSYLGPPAFDPSPQQFGSHANSQYQPPYSQGSSSTSNPLYPNLASMSGGASNYDFGNNTSPYQPQYQPPPSILFASLENYQGTVFPIPNFNPEADCQALKDAMKGFGTNERALIDIVANRSNIQRQQIKHAYKAMHGVDLTKQLASELSGNFKETMNALFETPAGFDAWSLNQAFYAGKQGTIREILLTRTNSEIRAIIDAFKYAYNKDLEKQISKSVIGSDFRRILISAVQAYRQELTPPQIQQAMQMGIESIIDRNLAVQDADTLYKAGAARWGTDESKFNAIFSQRNYYQLRATFEEYQRKYKKDIAQVIRSEFSGDAKDAYLVLVTCVRDRPTFFAERLHKAISGLGTNDSTLIRIIVTRSEIDLEQIKQRYHQIYNRTLAQDIAGDTSGDYKRLLLAIVKQ